MNVDEVFRAAKAELEQHGATDVRLERTKNHCRLRYWYKGDEGVYFMGHSPSDHRVIVRVKTDLRRILGVNKKKRRKASPPKRKRAPKPNPPEYVVSEAPTLTPGKDWTEPLRELRREMRQSGESK